MLPEVTPLTHNQEQGVFITQQAWASFLQQHQTLERLFTLRKGLKEAFQEVQAIQAGKATYITMEDFLNEC